MRNAPLYRGLMGLVLVAAALYASLQQTPRQVSVEQYPLARSRNHLVDCVEPLCREVLPHEAKLLFLATPVALPSINGPRAQIWAVDCLDAGGEARLRLLWNAENGRLVSLSRMNLQLPLREQPVINKAQAIHQARAWMERLAIVPHGDAQHCACLAETECSAYDIHFHLKSQSVTICINAYSNELLFVYVKN